VFAVTAQDGTSSTTTVGMTRAPAPTSNVVPGPSPGSSSGSLNWWQILLLIGAVMACSCCIAGSILLYWRDEDEDDEEVIKDGEVLEMNPVAAAATLVV